MFARVFGLLAEFVVLVVKAVFLLFLLLGLIVKVLWVEALQEVEA